ncbi:ATP-dependent helicase HrpB [Arcanobacterium pinnipediorum]|uniref:ATP-dependent helicase HrpB n=1 Tax=Arcanobacterium pinnipediorum TaxID=1503041 RepID=A0ABY5AHA0_9ACTO|nr:ATP-dependent helicase HrpB [Arcanobacterium pinnipediorum]USR79386.1 ATP-dependent helicase HrpB [Arcanobacterium pinnipediorum]
MRFCEICADPPDLPVREALGEIAGESGNLVIAAPPGSGKTTLVPVACAARLGGGIDVEHRKVIVVQPRRVAARAAARRIAQLLNEPVGTQVGYRVRGETKPGTDIEMVTPGVLLRMLHDDPELPGVGCVIIDEIHERDLDTDIATAFVLDAQRALRPDLQIIAMSATVALEQTANLLGARIIEVPGHIYPVETVEVPGPQPLTVTRSAAIVVSEDYLDHIAGVVRRAHREHAGSILVFVPGVREISAVVGRLHNLDIPVFGLHGQLDAREQDRVLDAGGERVIVATALAESSLTVPGVRIVVDGALARQARVDGGISGLVTVFASQASMIQRAGRAGREGPGFAYRCMGLGRAEKYAQPEIRTADLTDALLQCAAWGAPGMHGISLLDEPHPEHLAHASAELFALGFIDQAGTITARGQRAAQLPLSAYLARALIDGTRYVRPDTVTEIVAFLASDMRVEGADIAHAMRRRRNDPGLVRERRRLRNIITTLGNAGELADSGTTSSPTLPAMATTWDDAVGIVVALAHPQWIARARGRGYVLANGTGAVLPAGSPLAGEQWLAIADLGKTQGQSEAMIYAGVPIDVETAVEVGKHLRSETIEVDNQTLRASKVVWLGAIELSRTPAKLSAAQLLAARQEQVRHDSIADLPWTAGLTAIRHRLAFLHRALAQPWPDVSDHALSESIDEWLLPFVTAHGIDLAGALESLKPWEQAHLFDELAPERITTPLGSARVDYAGERPRVRMRIQEAFGWQATPEICGVPVTLELLSPAQRPLAITDDLASFWAGPYAGVRAEMRGRYPRHPWPEDPASAEPTRRAKKRR